MLELYLGWGLLIPAVLYLFRGYFSLWAMEALGFSRKRTAVRGFLYLLPELLLCCFWCMTGVALAWVYAAVFFCYVFRWCVKRSEWSRGFFIASFAQPLFMALHMLLIGLVSLFANRPMVLLLRQPFWRVATISAAALAAILADAAILYWPKLRDTLRMQAASEERRPFMAFLWLCNSFLLLDSLLCTAQIDWEWLPLLLIGAAALKELFLLHCFFHLRSIILERHNEEEHRALAQELDRQERRTEELKSMSDRDVLTGLFSRWYLMEQLELLLEKKRRFCLVFLDLDGLKQINDSQGHTAGDRYLIEFSKHVAGRLRAEDLFGRIGGDEFVILLLDCGKANAEVKLEKMRAELLQGKFEHVPSFSFGIAEAGVSAEESGYQLLEEADQKMYQDKESRGR